MEAVAANRDASRAAIEGFVKSWTSDHDEALTQAKIVFDEAFPAQAKSEWSQSQSELAV